MHREGASPCPFIIITHHLVPATDSCIVYSDGSPPPFTAYYLPSTALLATHPFTVRGALFNPFHCPSPVVTDELAPCLKIGLSLSPMYCLMLLNISKGTSPALFLHIFTETDCRAPCRLLVARPIVSWCLWRLDSFPDRQ